MIDVRDDGDVSNFRINFHNLVNSSKPAFIAQKLKNVCYETGRMQTPQNPKAPAEQNSEKERCSKCWKTPALCVCEGIKPAKSPVKLLILQHPGEAANELGTARLLSLSVAGTVHVVGYKWKSLGHALGLHKNQKAPPLREWAVLFVGTKKQAPKNAKPFELTTRAGEPLPTGALKGIILLDGNWSQSKTLWWRNSWLLRHPRILMNPPTRSNYNQVRRQPRKNYLSTIEAAAFCLENLSQKSPLPEQLRETFGKFVEQCRLVEEAKPKAPPRPPRQQPDSASVHT